MNLSRRNNATHMLRKYQLRNIFTVFIRGFISIFKWNKKRGVLRCLTLVFCRPECITSFRSDGLKMNWALRFLSLMILFR